MPNRSVDIAVRLLDAFVQGVVPPLEMIGRSYTVTPRENRERVTGNAVIEDNEHSTEATADSRLELFRVRFTRNDSIMVLGTPRSPSRSG